MSNEINTFSLYDGELRGNNPEREAREREEQRARRANLPKFILGKNEEFCIPREKINALNSEYFQMLDDMKAGFNIASEDLRSYMESVVFVSYVSDIYKMQQDGAADAKLNRRINEEKRTRLTPDYESIGWWIFKRFIPNQAMQLCIEEGALEAERELDKYRAEIARQSEFIYGEEPLPDKTGELFQILIEAFVPKRKRKRFIKKNGDKIMILLSEFMKNQRPISQAEPPAESAEERGELEDTEGAEEPTEDEPAAEAEAEHEQELPPEKPKAEEPPAESYAESERQPVEISAEEADDGEQDELAVLDEFEAEEVDGLKQEPTAKAEAENVQTKEVDGADEPAVSAEPDNVKQNKK